MATVTVTMYQGRYGHNRELITEKEYRKRMKEEAERRKASEQDFSEWLNENYSTKEIWDMDEEEKEATKGFFLQAVDEDILYDFREDWAEVRVEVEVDAPVQNEDNSVCSCKRKCPVCGK